MRAATNPELPGFNWRKITRHPALMEYNRLVFLVGATNLIVFVLGLREGWWFADGAYRLDAVADVALINIAMAILIRQQRVVNALFWLATWVPTSLAAVASLGSRQGLPLRWSSFRRYGFRNALVRIPAVRHGGQPAGRRGHAFRSNLDPDCGPGWSDDPDDRVGPRSGAGAVSQRL